MDYRNAAATRRSTVFARLTDYCGMVLAPDRVDSLLKDLEETMAEGPTAWAFRTEDAAAAERARIRRELLQEKLFFEDGPGEGMVSVPGEESTGHWVIQVESLDRICPEQ